MAYIPNSGSVVAFQGTVPWSVLGTITGSVAAVQSGTAITSISGIVNTAGSVIAFQGTSPWIVTGSVQASISPTANQSVSGTVQVDVRGSVATVIIGGSIAASFTPPANQSVSGTVIANQGTNPWIVTGSVQATLTPAANQSVSGTIGASVIGTVPVTQVTSPWTVVSSISGGIFPISGSVAAVVTNTVNVNTGGSVVAFQAGTRNTSIVSTVPSSVLVGASIFGQLPAGTAMIGSIAAYQGSVPWSMAGSVVSFQAGTTATSIQGTVSVLGTVPVTQSGAWAVSVLGSIPSSLLTGNYSQRNDSVSSFLGGNLTWNPISSDSAGRVLIKPFAAGESSLTSHNSVVSAGTTASVQLFAAAGAGLKNYITDFNISNTGATTALIIFGDGDGSVLGRTIAPAGGGSNHKYATPLVNVRANTPINLQLGSSSSVIYATVTGYKAP